MSFPRDRDDIERLRPKAARECLSLLMAQLDGYVDVHDSKDMLPILIELLDYADQDDLFGTEGWRQSLLGED